MRTCDVAIIGAGSAGLSARREIAQKTDNYVVIDDGPLGTTCARVGCMPSKVLIQAADDFARRRHFDELGIRGGEGLTLDSKQAMRHVRKLRDRFVGGIVIHAGDHATEVERLLLAMGRRPNVDDLGLENIGVELDAKGMPPFERDTLRIPGTSVFIAGDVTGDHPVLHEAADEGRIVGYNAAQDEDHCFRRRQGLTITFSSPNIAIVGRPRDRLARGTASISRPVP